MENFGIEGTKNIYDDYRKFFNDNGDKIKELFDKRAEKFIEYIRYKYDIGIGDVIQHKTDTYYGKPKTVWILGISAYTSSKPFYLSQLEDNKDLLTNEYVCLQGKMYDPVKGGYRKQKNIKNIFEWKVIAYRDPNLNVVND